MILILLLIELGMFQNGIASEICKLCDRYEQSSASSSELMSFCVEKVKGRCCLSDDGSYVTGVDLSNCSLSTLGIKNVSSNLLANPFLQFISLGDNKDFIFPGSNFRGMKNITKVIVNDNSICPNGDDSWLIIYTKNSSKICSQPIDVCLHMDNNTNCPINSNCVLEGPGLHSCLCTKGFHGYRCLRSGTFPYHSWFVGYGAAALVVIASIFFLQRKGIARGKVIKSQIRA